MNLKLQLTKSNYIIEYASSIADLNMFNFSRHTETKCIRSALLTINSVT